MDWFTDAPAMVVRNVAGMHGCGFYQAGIGEPAWSETVLEGRGRALTYTIASLREAGYRVEPEGRAAVGNPTYAMAAAAITRNNNGSPSSAAFAR
jgi:hypothetical protein